MLFFKVARKAGSDAFAEFDGFEPLPEFCDLCCRIGAGFDIRLNVKDPHAVDAGDLRNFGDSFALDKICNRDEADIGLHAQTVTRGDRTVLFRAAAPDVDFLFGIVGPPSANADAARDQLDHRANRGDIRAIAPGFGPVDLHLPLDAGQR